MVRVLALVIALAALGFSIYLAVLLGLIKRRGFGAGRRIELPAAALSFRVPSWWTEARGEPGEIRLGTGNHRGLLCLRPVDVFSGFGDQAARGGEQRGVPSLGAGVDDESAPAPAHRSGDPSTGGGARSPDPASALGCFIEASVHSMGLALDAVEIEVERLDPEVPGARPSPLPVPEALAGRAPFATPAARLPEGTWHAWLASGGKSAADPETRTYYEIHVIAREGGAAILVYTNGILFGPLDAFYVAGIVRTVRPLGEGVESLGEASPS